MRPIALIKSNIFFVLMGTSVMALVSCNGQSGYKPKMHFVEINNMQFVPAELTLHKGDTVMWINKDIVAHDATRVDSAWASPKLNSGDTWEKVVMKSDSYYCSIHVVMKGKLIVN